MKTMRRVVVYPNQIAIEITEIPVPGANEVLVRTVVTGVCGSDTHAARGRHPLVPLPYRPGHEASGVVESTGADVKGFAPGDRVTVEPYLPCWACKMCNTGRQNLCESQIFFGCGYDQGGMAEFFTLPADRLHHIPDSMDFYTAALIEPLSTPVHAVRLAGDVKGKAVAILGAGTIGLLMLSVLRAHGAGRIVISDPLLNKRELATALGADVSVDAMADDLAEQVRDALGESADVVFDCVASQASVLQAIAIADKGGTVMIVGVPTHAVTVPMPIIQDHQIRIQGTLAYLPEDYAESIHLLQAGKIKTVDFVTAIRPLDQVAEAFALSSSGSQVKVLITVADVGRF